MNFALFGRRVVCLFFFLRKIFLFCQERLWKRVARKIVLDFMAVKHSSFHNSCSDYDKEMMAIISGLLYKGKAGSQKVRKKVHKCAQNEIEDAHKTCSSTMLQKPENLVRIKSTFFVPFFIWFQFSSTFFHNFVQKIVTKERNVWWLKILVKSLNPQPAAALAWLTQSICYIFPFPQKREVIGNSWVQTSVSIFPFFCYCCASMCVMELSYACFPPTK